MVQFTNVDSVADLVFVAGVIFGVDVVAGVVIVAEVVLVAVVFVLERNLSSGSFLSASNFLLSDISSAPTSNK